MSGGNGQRADRYGRGPRGPRWFGLAAASAAFQAPPIDILRTPRHVHDAARGAAVFQPIQVPALVFDDVHHPRGQTLLSVRAQPEGGYDRDSPPPVGISEKGLTAAHLQITWCQQKELLPLGRTLSG